MPSLYIFAFNVCLYVARCVRLVGAQVRAICIDIIDNMIVITQKSTRFHEAPCIFYNLGYIEIKGYGIRQEGCYDVMCLLYKEVE